MRRPRGLQQRAQSFPILKIFARSRAPATHRNIRNF